MSNEWLKKRRKELKLSQDEVAQRLQLSGYDVSRSLVSHWENDRNAIPLNNDEFLTALATALETIPFNILSEAGLVQLHEWSEYAVHAAEIVDKLPENKKQAAVAILEQLLQIAPH